MTRASDDASRSDGEERRFDKADTTTSQRTESGHRHRPLIPHFIRIFAIPIILGWVALTVVVNVAVPTLEIVGENHSAPMAPLDAPSMKAMMRMGLNFKEFNSNSTVMVVVESQQPLGAAAHHYYDDIVRKLRHDTEHVQHIQDFWGDRFTAAGAQSADAKGAYVQVNIAGNQGTTQANESVEAVRKVVDNEPAPPGVKAYVTGPAALSDDMHVIGNDSLAKITLFTLAAIAIMLLLVYRSIVTTLIQLFMTFVALLCARGIVAVLGYNNAFGLTTFAANILTMLAIAAGTDYGIFLIGRYQEARAAGEDRETAYYTTFRGVAPVVLGSGLTIAGATYCLSFARLPWFNTMGPPVAIGMIVVVAAGLTLGPAVVFLGSRFGLFEKKSQSRGRLWRRVGTAVVRWPAPVFAVSAAVVLVGMVALPGFKTELQRPPLPARISAVQHRVRCGRPALLRSTDESGHADDRSRPRHAQSGRHARAGQGRQERDPHRRYRDDPGHHQTPGDSDSAQLDPLSEQHPKPDDHAEHELSERQNERHSEDGRRVGDHHKLLGADV